MSDKLARALNLANLQEQGPDTAAACRNLVAIELRNQHAMLCLMKETLEFYQKTVFRQKNGETYVTHALELDAGDRATHALNLLNEYFTL